MQKPNYTSGKCLKTVSNLNDIRCDFLCNFSSSFDYFKLELGANPLRCSCGIRWLYMQLRDANAFRLSGLSWTCDDGRRFSQLTDTDFAPCPVPSCLVVTPPPDLERQNSTESPHELPLVLQVRFISKAKSYRCTLSVVCNTSVTIVLRLTAHPFFTKLADRKLLVVVVTLK